MARKPKTRDPAAVLPGPEPMWSLEQTALFLNRPKGTLYQWASRRYGPPSYKVGNSRMYIESEVREWLRSHRTAPAA